MSKFRVRIDSIYEMIAIQVLLNLLNSNKPNRAQHCTLYATAYEILLYLRRLFVFRYCQPTPLLLDLWKRRRKQQTKNKKKNLVV